MNCTDLHQPIVEEIKTHLSVVASGDSVGDISFSFVELSKYFQGLAICHLLESANISSFAENLIRSGHSRRYFLKECKERELHSDRNLGLSRSEAFLDVVAGGHMELARELAISSTAEWNPDWEYEDDYCFYKFLHLCLLPNEKSSISQFSAILDQFEHSLEDGESFRWQVCEAILTRNEGQLNESLRSLLEQIQQTNDIKRETVESYEFLFWPRSFVSIEGLALIKIAKLHGLRVEKELPLCPEIGTIAASQLKVMDIFEEIKRNIGA